MNNAEKIAYLQGMAVAIIGLPTNKQWNDFKAILAKGVSTSNKKQQPIQAPKRKR